MITVLLTAPSSASTASPSLDPFWADMGQASLYKKWKSQNVGEYQKLVDYAAGFPRPALATWFGKALVAVVDVQRGLGDTTILIP